MHPLFSGQTEGLRRGLFFRRRQGRNALLLAVAVATVASSGQTDQGQRTDDPLVPRVVAGGDGGDGGRGGGGGGLRLSGSRSGRLGLASGGSFSGSGFVQDGGIRNVGGVHANLRFP